MAGVAATGVDAWLLAGSVVGPSLYFLGLKLTSGVQGILLINLEAVFTATLRGVVAALIFLHERLDTASMSGGC